MSRHAPFNREMDVYMQSSPGVAGDLLGRVPCRVVSAAHIIDSLWAGVVQWTYITTPSELPQGPSYSVSRGTFEQACDFTGASLLRLVEDEPIDVICTHKQVLVFAGGETYYRFAIAEAASFVPEVPVNVDCGHSSYVAASGDVIPWSILGEYERWYYTDYPLNHCVHFTTDNDGIVCRVYRGLCSGLDLVATLLNGESVTVDVSEFPGGVTHMAISGAEETGSGTVEWHIGDC